ncbi:MAG: hypothetical protein R3Y09_11770 [Clostridia bacterium]
MKKHETVQRYSMWDGRETHKDHYYGGKKTGSSVERYSAWDGKKIRTDHYDKHGNYVGKSR